MSNELSVNTGKLIEAVEEKEIGEVLKPLITKIHLFDTYVAGTSYVPDESVFDKIKEGDRLILRREENKFDDKAILVLTEDNMKMGYIPEKDNLIFARLMDAGKMLEGIICLIKEENNGYRSIRIGIYLVDY